MSEYKINILNKHRDNYFGSITNIYIGRGSILGNPFTHLNKSETLAEFQVETREDALKNYGKYFIESFKTKKEFRKYVIDLMSLLKQQKEINFLCYCSPNGCHGDFVKEFILRKINDL